MRYIEMDVLEQAFIDADLDIEENLRENYSGRGMYGRECFGIVHSTQSQIMQFILFLDRLVRDEDPDLAFELTESASADSMGLDRITYFPGFLVGTEED